MAQDRAAEPAVAGARHAGGAPASAASRHPRRAAAPLLVLGGVIAGGAVLALAPNALLAAVPPCPFRTLTGLDCPFCGGTRAVLALLHGDVAGAAGYNVLVTVAAVLAAGLLVWWLVARIRPGIAWPGGALLRSRAVLIGGVAVIGVFWVVRNLPFLPYLASAT